MLCDQRFGYNIKNLFVTQWQCNQRLQGFINKINLNNRIS